MDVFADRGFAYALLALAAAGEGLPVVGLLVPGGALAVAAGVAAAHGALDVGDVVVSLALGAFFGDVTSFFVGGRFAPPAASTWTRRLAGVPTPVLALARFLPPVRGVAAAWAGKEHRSAAAFVPWAAVATTLWAGLHVGAGYVGGTLLSAAAGREITAGAAVALVAASLIFAWTRRGRQAS